MISEIFLLIAIFALCVFLAFEDLRSAFIFLLIVSPLLHKEVFSLVRWDVLPIRLVILSLLFTSFLKFLYWFKHKRDLSTVYSYVKDPLFILLFVLWLSRLISLINTRNIGASFFIFAFFSTIVFLYLLISYLAKRYGERFILSNIKFYTFIAFFTSVIALLQFVLDRKFGIIFGALWRIPGKWSRVGSVFWDVNHYGGFLSAIIPIVIGMFFSAKSTFSRVVYAFMAIFMTSILLLTNSRSAWLGFGAALMVMFYNLFIWKFGKKRLIYVFLFAILLLIPPSIEYRKHDSVFREKIKSYFHYRGDSFASHFMLIEGAYAVFSKYPIIGGGYGSFFEHFKDSYVAATYYSRDPAALSVRVPAHSIWGEVLAETGFIGTFTFVLIVLTLFTTIFLTISSHYDSQEKYILLGSASSIFGFLVSGIFYSYNAEFFWIIIFLSFIYAKSLLGTNYNITSLSNYYFKNSSLPLYMLLIVSSVFIFTKLGVNYLIPWDEAIYAKVTKNILASGDYLNLRWDTKEAWLEKPPLYMWSSSIFMFLMGANSWSVKLPSAIFGFGTLIITYLLGKKLFNKNTGFLAAIALLSTVHFLHYARIGMLDVTLTFFITASMLAYFISLEKRSLFWVTIAGMLGGLAFMTKGIVGGLILPIFILMEFYTAFTQKETTFVKYLYKRLSFMSLFVLGILVIALPWHLYSYIEHKDDFIETYFGYHVLKRATESIEGKGRPVYWYLIVMRTSMRVWFIVFVLAVIAYILSIKSNITKGLSKIFPNERNINMLFIWFFVIFSFFSLSVSKLIWYIMPVYPVACLICARFIDVNISKLKTIKSGLLYSLLTLLIPALSLLYLFNVRSMVYPENNTEDVALLVMEKDKTRGIQEKLYYDRIEKPLVLFYTNGPVEAVDFKPLVREIDDAGYMESINFITNERRYKQILETYPNIDTLRVEGDFYLGRAVPEGERILTQISMLEEEIKWIEEKMLLEDAAKMRVSELPQLRTKLNELKTTHEMKLKKN